MGNVGLFDKECLSYWSENAVNYTYGQLLKEIVANRGLIEYTLDLLSNPNYVIKKGRLHDDRYGKTPHQKKYYQAHNLKKKCSKKHFKSIHDLFSKDSEFLASKLEHDRDEKVCIKMDDFVDKDFSHYMTKSEYFRYNQNWRIFFNKSGNTGSLRNLFDFNDAMSTLNSLIQKFGERQLRAVSFWMCEKWHQSSSFSSSWRQWSASWKSS